MSYQIMRDTAEELVDQLLKEAGTKDIHITESISRTAREAAAQYGKLVGHPAKLNMGDCFAYACANLVPKTSPLSPDGK